MTSERAGVDGLRVRAVRARITGSVRPRRVPLASVGLVAAFVGYAAWFLLNDVGAETRTLVADLFYPLLCGAVACVAWAASRRSGTERARRAWALFAAAMLARASADMAWFWLEAVRHTEPFPSIADIGYGVSYLLMFAAVWQLGSPRRGLDRRSLTLDVAAVATGSFLLIWQLLLSRITEVALPIAQQVLSVGYPVGDAVLITVTVMLILRRPPWLPTSALILLTSGLLAWAAADVLWTGLLLGSDYAGGDWIDLIWLGAIVTWGVSADLCRHSTAPLSRELPQTRVEQVVPFVGLVMGQCALLAQLRVVSFRSSGVVIIGAALLCVLVVCRQSAVKRDHAALLDKYYEIATVDALTGLMRRETFIDKAEREITRASRAGSPLVVLMIDIDRFKGINDNHGHAGGDAVLATVSRLCLELRGSADLVGRLGGDELIVLLPDAHEANGLAVARRLLDQVARHPVLVEGRSVHVSLSIGVAESRGDEALVALMARADVALYRAKTAGRGIAVAHSAAVSPEAARVLPGPSHGPLVAAVEG